MVVHPVVGLARAIYIHGVYAVVVTGKLPNTVIYGVNTLFWPALLIWVPGGALFGSAHIYILPAILASPTHLCTGWCSSWECPHLHLARHVWTLKPFLRTSHQSPTSSGLQEERVCVYMYICNACVWKCVCVCVCVSVCVWRMYVFKCECVTLPSFVWQSQYISLHNAGRGALPDPQFTVSAPRSLPPSAKEITAKRPQKCYTRTHNTLSKNNWTGSKKRLKGATLIPGTVIFLRHDQAWNG
jgi:hypothetical protein